VPLGLFLSIPTMRRARHTHTSGPMTISPGTPSPSSDSAQKVLSASSIGALRFWLQTQRSTALAGRPLRRNDLRRAMRLVCNEVRRRDLPVERLIVLLKEQWFTLADDGDGATTRSREALDEIIRTCIDEFYASTAASSTAPAANRTRENLR
jgi:hypothetical protein